MNQPLKQAVEADDCAAAARLLEAEPSLLAPGASEHSDAALHLMAAVRSVEMAEVFLDRGVEITRVSTGWASGFGLETLPPEVAEHLVRRGAVLTPHAAAALGLVGPLRSLLDREPELVHAKGGDGGRPLHFSRNLEIAQLLVERGAELDPHDDDHDSTPAQWCIRRAPEVTRFLLQRGARPDIFMAAGLGDLDLAKRLVAQEPDCTTFRIGNNSGPFPGIGARGGGGTIYQWTLGFNRSPQEIALERSHRELFDFLMSRTPPRSQLLIACMQTDRPRALALVTRYPSLVGELNDEDRALLAKCCWETNLNLEAVRLMLDLGFPVNAPEFNHGYQPLHNAAWCGDPELVALLLQRGHPVGDRDPTYQSTPLGFAMHSCVVARRHPEGDFPRVVRLLLEAGSPLEARNFPTGHAGIDAVIETFQRD